MVKARKKTEVVTPGAPSNGVNHSDMTRISNLLALLLVKGEAQKDKIRTLSAAGFTTSEMSSLLGLSPGAINIALHRIRKNGE